MLQKIPYKVVALSTLLTMTATTLAAPSTAVFANSIEQSTIENGNLSANTDAMKKTLKEAGDFAQAMNVYSYELLHNPDVNFQGVNLEGHADLPNQLLKDQQNARTHATTWDTKVKRQLLDTLTGIITYDTTFDNYYSILVNAAQTEDKETLKEGITDLQTDIRTNKQKADTLIQALNALREDISDDDRSFRGHAQTLHSILSNQTTGLETDEKLLDELKSKRDGKMESLGHADTVILTVLTGGTLLVVKMIEISGLNSTISKLNQTVDAKKTLNRVVKLASDNVDSMGTAIDNAVKALTYMSTQWNDLDSQYDGVLQMIDKADEKITTNKYAFLKPTLDTAKDSWKTLKADATTLKEGLKELKINGTSK